ncbi:ABATE domain-containing protein [Nonomuraea salmonea]|uniref:ABATE domain-containing protein n=1 Tax=Nonomuraea salmonea TaxID=46181 RepID=UPI0031ED199B
MPFSTELVRDFVNTFDVETQTDELSSPAELALWLRERDLAGPPTTGRPTTTCGPRTSCVRACGRRSGARRPTCRGSPCGWW